MHNLDSNYSPGKQVSDASKDNPEAIIGGMKGLFE